MSEEHVTEGGVWGGYCNARVGHIQVHWIAGGMVRWGSPETPSQNRQFTVHRLPNGLRNPINRDSRWKSKKYDKNDYLNRTMRGAKRRVGWDGGNRMWFGETFGLPLTCSSTSIAPH